jgi:hypothetical protein
MVLGAFLDIEGAFEKTCFNAMVGVARGVGWKKPVVGGSGPCLRADRYMLLLLAVV